MVFKFGLDEVPPPLELILFGLQWLAISIPTVIIIGKVVAVLHFASPADQVVYIQKTFFVTGAALFAQLIWGHRLPLVMGPSAVLLVGIVASTGSSMGEIYTAIAVGGLVLFAVSAAGLFGGLKKLFTPRVVATILVLIAFTLTPTIMNMIVGPAGGSPLFNITFALVFVLAMFVANRRLGGIWKSTLIIWAIIAGSLIHLWLAPGGAGPVPEHFRPVGAFFSGMNFVPEISPAVLASFLVCFLALSINDLGSIQSLGQMLGPSDMQRRITRGISLTGLANVLSGLFGVIGTVNFSMSPGVIASTGCASRYTLMPAAAGMLAMSFLPASIAFVGGIPSTVIGTVLIYIMSSQVAAGLIVAFGAEGFRFEDGLVIGLPLMLGIIISFLPGPVLATFPAPLRPVLGNGFVIGVLSVLFLEHVIYKGRG